MVIILKEKANHFDYVLVKQEFQYSVQYGLQYNVNIIVLYSLKLSVQCIVQYGVQKVCISLKAGNIVFLREQAGHFDVVVQYDKDKVYSTMYSTEYSMV